MDDFLWRALLAGLAVATMAGSLGVFLLWRRMAFFGDTLAHSALLGVTLGLLAGGSSNTWIVAVCLAVALGLLYLQANPTLGTDTLLAILAHSTLAAGTVALAFLPGVRVDLLGYLFGDILAVSTADVGLAWGLAVLVVAAMAWLWRPLLAIAVHPELAQVEGKPVWPAHAAYMLLVALMVAVAMKLVGVLLLTALLIIPAAAARRFAHTPEQMAGLAILVGILALVGGLVLSLHWDTPAGPSIVLAAGLLFLLTQMLGRPWK